MVLLCYLPTGQSGRRLVLAHQTEEISGIARSVALCGRADFGAGVEVVLGNGELLLEFKWCFDKRGNETRGNVPLDVAMEKPDA